MMAVRPSTRTINDFAESDLLFYGMLGDSPFRHWFVSQRSLANITFIIGGASL
jgi:hypothetical protein